MDQDKNRPTLNPTALAVADVAQLLTKASGQIVTVAMIEADLAASAPANPDGTINLVHFAAWLARESNRGD